VVLVTTSLDTVYNLAAPAAPLDPPTGSLMESVTGRLVAGPDGYASWDLHRSVKYELEAHGGIHLLQSTVSTVLVGAEGEAVGAGTWEGIDRHARLTALCVGSFLRARLTTGAVTETQGRLSEMAYDDLYEDLVARGFAFEPVRFSGEPRAGSLPYVVESVALAHGERGGRGADSAPRPSAALWRVRGLFAAGACMAAPAAGTPAVTRAGAGGDTSAYLSYEAAASQGMDLGDELVALSAPRRGS